MKRIFKAPKSLWVLCLFLMCTHQVMAQTFTIKGRVIDYDTEESMPFANVFFENGTGVTTDLEGYYILETDELEDSLIVSSMGSEDLKKSVNPDLAIQEINFKLRSSSLVMTELVIYPGENPAHPIVRGIIANRKTNNIEKRNSYECERYSKVELDLHNFDTTLFDSKVMKPFDFILDNIDSTSDEKIFLPAYINENIDDLFFIKKRPLKVIQRATRTSGVDASTVVAQTKRLHQAYNIYDTWIPVLEKQFASPVSSLGFFYYKYYLIDSTFINDKWSYQIKFEPKRKQENTFFGEFWVADTSFAIVRLNMRKTPEVNLNLVDRVLIFEEYGTKDSLWLPVKQKMVVDFLPTDKFPGIIARKTTVFKSFKIDDPTTITRYKEKDPEDYEVVELKRPDEYWDENRFEELSKNELTVYQMIDSVKNSPIYKKYSDAVYTITTGWLKIGKLEIGPHYNIYGGNIVEGNRFQLGLGTNLEFSKKFRPEIFVGYGTKDKKWKYGGKFQYNFKGQPRRTFIGASFFDDVIYSNQSSEEAIATSSLASFFRRDIPQRLLHSKEAKVFYQKEFKRGWSTRFSLLNREVDPYGGVYADGSGFNFQFISPQTNEIDTIVTTTEFTFKLRHAYKEQYVAGFFERISLGSRYPIYSLQYTAGIKDVMGSEHTYHKIAIDYDHWFFIQPLGWTRYYLRAGKTFGTLPSLLLEGHTGNETYFYGANTFNLMNRYEFTSDTYLCWTVVHHFDGYLFNKIPLLRKLDWRALAGFRGVWGTLTDANAEANRLNTSDVGGTIPFRSPFPTPYMEANFGIENIFKVFQIQAIWRLNYMDNPEANRFMIQGGVYFAF